MRSLLVQISSISALLVLLNQLWSYASLERALVVTAVVGVAVYGVLLVGQRIARHIVNTTETAPPPTSASDAPPTESPSSMQPTS